jgi:hypothetical protein
MGGVVDGRARGPYPHLDNAKTPSDRLRDTKIRRQGASRIGSNLVRKNGAPDAIRTRDLCLGGQPFHRYFALGRLPCAYLPGTEDQMLT